MNLAQKSSSRPPILHGVQPACKKPHIKILRIGLSDYLQGELAVYRRYARGNTCDFFRFPRA